MSALTTLLRFRLRYLIALAAALLFAVGSQRMTALQPQHQKGVLQTQPPTPYIHYPSTASVAQRILVIHGLDSNKEYMQIFCSALADAGFEVYAIDLPGHGDSQAGFNGILAGDVIEQVVSLLKPDIAIGHSMGASLLIDLSHHIRFKKTVLISPGTTAVNGLTFENTLVTAETFDIPAVSWFAPRLDGADLRQFTWGTHSSALFKPDQIREIVSWLGGDTSRLRTDQRLRWLDVMTAAAIVLGIALLPYRPPQAAVGAAFSTKDVFLWYIAAGAISVIVLRFIVPLRWIGLFAMDYMISFLFIAGIVLMAVLAAKKQVPAVTLTAVIKGVVIAALVILLAVLAGGYLTHMTLSGGRWWRFIVIAIASFPLFLFDETVTRETEK
ncbi:MAG TPA: alpha/beta fold hydrolase, partial [Terriglobia bacterium]|nr:alpha/beta fold hydrolase [Terriglobia bacterium]